MFPGHRTEGETQLQSSGFPKLRENQWVRIQSQGRPRWIEFIGQSTKEDSSLRRRRELQSSLLWAFSWLLITTCTRRNYLKLWKEPPNIIKKTGDLCSHRARNSTCSHQPDWKASQIHGALDRMLRRLLPKAWGIISTRLITPLCLPNKFENQDPEGIQPFPSNLIMF